MNEYLHILGKRILAHRYRYYHLDAPVISDWEYDYLEKYYENLCKQAGIEAYTEKMVGIDLKHPVVQEIGYEVTMEIDDYSKWLKEMNVVWARLGKPKYLRIG